MTNRCYDIIQTRTSAVLSFTGKWALFDLTGLESIFIKSLLILCIMTYLFDLFLSNNKLVRLMTYNIGLGNQLLKW